MNVNEMTLGGYTVGQLKEMNALVKRDASKFMAEQIEFVKSEVTAIVASAEEHAAEYGEGFYKPDDQRVKELVDICEAIQVVSGVSGVGYSIPYRDQYGYADEGTPLSQLLEENLSFSYSNGDPLYYLYSELDDMEGSVREWNQSSC